MKKGVLKKFARFTGKHPCQISFTIKLQETQVLSCELCEIFKNTLFIEHLRPTASDECKMKDSEKLLH